MIRISSLVICSLSLSACASATKTWQENELPAAPAAWTASADVGGTLAADWVASLGDAALPALVAEAMAHNNDVMAASHRLRSARNSARVGRSQLLPTVDANFNSSRNAIVVDPTAAAQAGGAGGGSSRVYVNNFVLGAQTSWELDLWGRISDNTRASYADAAAASADFAATRLSIAGATAQAWFDLIEAHLQRRLAESDVETQERSLRLVERRYGRGVSQSLDVRLARSALASSEATLAARQRAEKEASRALEVLLGRYPGAEIEAAQSLPALASLQGAGAPLEILARRPDLISAEQSLEAAGLRARAARKLLLPRLTLSANINGSGPELSDVLDPDRLAGNIAGGLLQPLFRGGAIWFDAERQKAQAKAQLYDYARAILTAYQEAENALAAESLLEQREISLSVAYEEALAAERLAERQYGNGIATIFELLDAQERRITAQSQFISASKERLANRVRLYLAIGGEFLTAAALPETAAAEANEGSAI